MALRTLHCYAEGREGDWEAICLDLDIAVQGQCFEEVFSSLQRAISLYCETVAGLPPEERQSLLHRPVPFLVRLKLVVLTALGAYSGAARQRQRHRFAVPPVT